MRGHRAWRLASVAIVAASLVSLAVVDARAANDGGFTFGDDADLTAGAVAPVTLGPSAAWYNPAGLAGIDRLSLSGSASGFVLRLRQINGLIRTPLPDRTLESDVSSLKFISVPTAFVLARQLGEGFAGAIGVFMPESEQFGFRASKSARIDLGYGEAPFDQEFSISIAKQRYHIGAVFGGVVTPALRLGGGLFLVYATSSYDGVLYGAAESTFDEDGAEVTPLGFGVSSDSTRQTTIGGQLTAGLQWDATCHLGVSLVLRSPAIALYRFGSRRSLSALAGAVPALAETGDIFSETTDRPANAVGSMMLPFQVHLGLAWRWEGGWIAIEGQLKAPVKNDALFIDRDLSGNVRLGVLQRLDEHWAFGGGLFTDLASTPRPEQLGDFHLDYVGATFGMALDTPLGLVDEERPRGLLMSTTVALRYAVGWGTAGGVTFDPLSPDANRFVTTHESPVVFHDIALQIGSKLTY